MSEIAWDINVIEILREHLDRLSSNMDEIMRRIKTIQTEANGQWESEAGKLYSTRIDADLQELGKFRDSCKQLAGKLEEAKRDYASGEQEVHNSLIGALQRLSIPF